MVFVLKKEKPTIWFWAVILSAIGLLLSLYSSYEYVHLRYFPFIGGEAACNINESLNCEQAIRSPYAVLLGRSLGCWGASFYSAILFFLFFSTPETETRPRAGLSVLLVLSFFSVLGSCLLGYISFTQLTALCPVCLSLYAVSLLLFVVVYLFEREESLVERLRVGLSELIRIPFLAARFIVRRTGEHIFTRYSPLLIFFLIVTLVSFLSDSVFIQILRASESMEERQEIAVAEWMNQPIQNIPYEGEGFLRDYRRGDQDAKIRVVEFFDFECPACRAFSYEMKDIIDTFGDDIAVEYRNYPLDKSCNRSMTFEMHQTACLAAEYARCAGEQGKFFEAADYLITLEAFEMHAKNPSAVKSAIKDSSIPLGLDPAMMEECLASNRQRESIERDIEIADYLGLQGTPSVWVNGRLVLRPSLLKDLIQYLVNKKKSSS